MHYSARAAPQGLDGVRAASALGTIVDAVRTHMLQVTGQSPHTHPSAAGRGFRARLRRVVLFARRNAFGLAALGLALVLLLPMASVVTVAVAPGSGTLAHLLATVLGTYLLNTLMLLIGVSVGVLLVGTGAAWLVTACDFPGRRIFEWALVVPMAVPAYIMAYAYTDLLSHPGFVQSSLRDLTGWGPRDYWFPNVRSIGGAIAMFTLVLYPYVYLLARRAFLEQSRSCSEVARTLGQTPWGLFWTISLPMARPALAGGTALALMETLADFGTVAHFGVPTFTTGIYKALFSMDDAVAAAQLSSVLLMVVFAVVLIERLERGKAQYFDARGDHRVRRYVLNGWHAFAAVIGVLLPISFGFIIPVLTLINLSIYDGHSVFSARYVALIVNSVTLAGLAALMAVSVALVLALAGRFNPSGLTIAANRAASLGYAVPGSVIAVGILIPLAAFDRTLDTFMRETFGVSTGLLLLGSIAGMVFAYVVRFMAVALNGIEASLSKIPPNVDAAARVLGRNRWGMLRAVHFPLLRGGLLTAALMVFVDTMKELPATLIIRPFNYDTLAVQAYRLASDERLAQASTPALVLVGVGLLPVFVLGRRLMVSQAHPGAGP